MQEISQAPVATIYPSYTSKGYVYLHIPKRVCDQIGLTSGTYLVTYIKGRSLLLTIAQEGGDSHAHELGGTTTNPK
jgi:hypothetical protein